uniref:Uncharacterized protein n=1 Tax=Arundo donax TaxID=35708 RepID=A0A0A9CHZ0_ARUDO
MIIGSYKKICRLLHLTRLSINQDVRNITKMTYVILSILFL